jgi:hypothetical protein
MCDTTCSSSIGKDQSQVLRQLLGVLVLASERAIDDPRLPLLQREHLVVDARPDEEACDEDLSSLTESVDSGTTKR